MENGKGVLSADVTTGGETKGAVPLVEFDAKGLKTEGALATLTDAPATLTEGGSQAFGSMYKAGTEMDPVSLAVALDATAKLPALPDLGSTAPPAPPAAPGPSPAPVAEEGESSNAGPYVALGVAVLVLVGGATLLLLRRNRRTEPTPAGPDAPIAPPAPDAPTTPTAPTTSDAPGGSAGSGGPQQSRP